MPPGDERLPGPATQLPAARLDRLDAFPQPEAAIIAWMKYAVIAVYTQDASIIAKARPMHREYLSRLIQQGNLVMSGPFTDDRGGLLIYEAETSARVEKLIAEDPFATQGVFVSWEIRPWNVVFVNPELLCP